MGGRIENTDLGGGLRDGEPRKNASRAEVCQIATESSLRVLNFALGAASWRKAEKERMKLTGGRGRKSGRKSF